MRDGEFLDAMVLIPVSNERKSRSGNDPLLGLHGNSLLQQQTANRFTTNLSMVYSKSRSKLTDLLLY